MRCEDVTANAADHLAGSLPAEVTEAIRLHLAGCAACRNELVELDDTWHMLDTVAAERPDSEAMRVRFNSALHRYQEEQRQGAAVRLRRWWSGWSQVVRLPLQVAGGVALVVVAVAVGRATVSGVPPVDDSQLTALRQEVSEMRLMLTMSLLQQESAANRLEGIAWAARLEKPGSEIVSALLDTLKNDANVNVRLASIDALKRFAEQEAVRRGAIEALSRQASPLVQIALIDFVLESSGSEAASALRRLSQDAMVAEVVRMHAVSRLAQFGAKS